MPFSLDSGNVGTTSQSSGPYTSSTATVTSICAVGKLLTMEVRTNDSGSDGETSNHTSASDTQGNTWTKAKEWSNSSSTTTSLWYCVVATGLTTSDTVTVNFSSANYTIQRLNLWSNPYSTIGVDGSTGDATDAAAGPVTLVLSSLTSREHIYFRLDGVDNGAARVDWAASTGYTKLSTIGGVFRGIGSEYKIETSAGSTSDPGDSTSEGNRASVFVAFYGTSGATHQRSPSGGVAYGGHSY